MSNTIKVDHVNPKTTLVMLPEGCVFEDEKAQGAEVWATSTSNEWCVTLDGADVTFRTTRQAAINYVLRWVTCPSGTTVETQYEYGPKAWDTVVSDRPRGSKWL